MKNLLSFVLPGPLRPVLHNSLGATPHWKYACEPHALLYVTEIGEPLHFGAEKQRRAAAPSNHIGAPIVQPNTTGVAWRCDGPHSKDELLWIAQAKYFSGRHTTRPCCGRSTREILRALWAPEELGREGADWLRRFTRLTFDPQEHTSTTPAEVMRWLSAYFPALSTPAMPCVWVAREQAEMLNSVIKAIDTVKAPPVMAASFGAAYTRDPAEGAAWHADLIRNSHKALRTFTVLAAIAQESAGEIRGAQHLTNPNFLDQYLSLRGLLA